MLFKYNCLILFVYNIFRDNLDKTVPYDITALADIKASSFHEGDVLVFNTVADQCKPSDYIGKYHINILCRGGNALFTMSERTFTILAGDFLSWPIDSKITEMLYSPDFEADILLISKNFLRENNPQPSWATKWYLYVKDNPVFHLESAEMALLAYDFACLKSRLKKTDHIFCREILGRQMQIFLYDLWNIYASEIKRHKNLNNNTANIFARFLDLVRQRNTESREVAFYADLLCITPKYLSEVVRRASGKPASYWINGYAIQEIVVLLKRQDLTISEISSRLNFNSQSHFSRFVKNVLGVSPTAYRNQLEGKSEH